MQLPWKSNMVHRAIKLAWWEGIAEGLMVGEDGVWNLKAAKEANLEEKQYRERNVGRNEWVNEWRR